MLLLSSPLCSSLPHYWSFGHVTCFTYLLMANKCDTNRGLKTTWCWGLLNRWPIESEQMNFCSCLKTLTFGIVYHTAKYNGCRWNTDIFFWAWYTISLSFSPSLTWYLEHAFHVRSSLECPQKGLAWVGWGRHSEMDSQSGLENRLGASSKEVKRLNKQWNV